MVENWSMGICARVFDDEIIGIGARMQNRDFEGATRGIEME